MYFQVMKSEDFINSAYNARQDSFSGSVVRGQILAADGTVLATSELDEEGNETRVYPYGNQFAHVVGYVTHGNLGIEQMANFNLLRSNTFFLEKVYYDLTNQKQVGDNVYTTLDVNLQQVAYDALGDYEGAVMVMQPSTGKVLAMVSKPDFDPNTIAQDWDSLSADEESSVLLNRATQGAYPPGSTFKLLTTLAYMRENSNFSNYSYTCDGEIEAGNYTVHCFDNKAHGAEDITMSLANSCNTSFSNIGLSLDGNRFKKMCEQLYFNKDLPGNFLTKKSSFSMDSSTADAKVMQTSIGQGDTLMSPYHMLLIVSAIANDGMLMEPYIIERTENKDGQTIKEYSSREYERLLEVEEAESLQGMMRAVVEQGTATGLQSDRYIAYGKTGSAEMNSQKDSHAWFVGFAKQDGVEQSDIAVVVVAEEAGTGGRHAVPIAQKIFDAYYP